MTGNQLCQFYTILAALLTFNLSTSVTSIAIKFHYMRAIIERLRDSWGPCLAVLKRYLYWNLFWVPKCLVKSHRSVFFIWAEGHTESAYTFFGSAKSRNIPSTPRHFFQFLFKNSQKCIFCVSVSDKLLCIAFRWDALWKNGGHIYIFIRRKCFYFRQTRIFCYLSILFWLHFIWPIANCPLTI